MITRIEVVADPVRDRCLLTTGLLSPRRLPAADGVVRVALIAASALLLAGDHVEIQVVVQGPVRVEIVETAGTVAYAMRGGSARWDVTVALTDGAQLTWHGEPFVVSEGADVLRSMEVNLESGCSAAIRESLVFGRHGETGGTLRSSQRAWLDGELLLAEDLDLAPEARQGWAILGTARCLDSLTTLGRRLPETPATPASADKQVEAGSLGSAGARGVPAVLQLEGVGSVDRRLVGEQHESDLAQSWAALLATDKISGCS
ncbi:urease accessory protein UreD [Streptomyces sp. SID13031]|uniref:urease accessory protein UreD n=1 Tax=Streptomyces sp. SID13031 TaxID=2706046 RepID=UPI0013C93D6F|nr:urease accessory protein UreD [Streptomyces sp. SID13031]NEA33940.1 urease accessory protein UreD [Streptomyces sp. SID13031]